MSEFLKLIILFSSSYILGAIPFAFIFTRLFSKKNILEIGWKKASTSNVMKNVGVLPGVLTFVFDVLKGFVVVFLAKEFGFCFVAQAMAGFFVVLGHNYSMFLNFKGGRGIATLLGAIFAFNYLIGIMLLIPVLISAIVWTAGIGTVVSYVLGIIFSKDGLLLLFLLCLTPIVLKRVLPFEKKYFVNRLLFDQDNVPCLRVKKK